MNNQVDEVKAKTDIVSIIGERIELKKAGRNYKAICPFHGEKTPSFMVSPELGIFKCFGCDAKGDVFSFLEQFEGMEFGEALKYLADRAGVKLEKSNFGAPNEKEKLIEVNINAMRFYNYILLNHPAGLRALDYLLTQRGIKKETIEEFQIGYSPESSYAIKKYLMDKKKFTLSEIEHAGIAGGRGGNIYDRFNGRVIFPLFDHRGNPIGFAGRILPWDKRDTGKYINCPETPLYHKSSVLFGLNLTRSFIKKKKVAIVVEGEIDLISSYQAGIKNIVAIKGSALTEEQVRLLGRFAPKFILALDADVAGDAAARRGIKVAGEIGVEVKVARITGYKDPDDAVRGNLESYKNDLIRAEGIYDFLIDSVFGRFDSQSGAGKAKISKEIVPILGEIADKIVQAHYANLVARKLEVPLEAVLEQITKISSVGKSASTEVTVDKLEERGRKDLLEERLLALTFESNPKILDSKSLSDLITLPLNKKIVEEYQKFTSGKTFNLSDFGKSLPAELFAGFTKIILTESGDLLEKPEKLNQELDLVKKELKIQTVREKLKILASKMREKEGTEESVELTKIQNEFDKLSKSLSGYEEEDGGGLILKE